MQKIKFEYRIIALYLLIGCLWIAFSDKLLYYLVKDPDLATRFQTYKGWFYVIVTALLLYIMLQRHLARLRNAEHRAKESDRLKTAFLQNISHEIRTPMNSIIGFTELIKGKKMSEEERSEFLDIITLSSNQLLNIVNEVLDISLIETGNTKVNFKKVHLNSLLEEIRVFFKPLVKKEIIFSFEMDLSDPQSYILTDEVKFRQILNNLINNAIKFTDSGHITVGYLLKNNELEFYVEDTGIGIQESLHTEIFERFHKADTEKSRFYEGVGLGLSICKGNIELLNGRIWLKSNSGVGSTFFFTIPYNPADQTENNIKQIQGIEEYPTDLTILIVEDDKANSLYITRILDKAGIKYLHAKNGKEAVELCRENKNISIVLMDLKMPLMNGYEASGKIKEIRPEIRIIAQTAYSMSEEKEKALCSGCDDYISKPFKREQLLSLIKKHTDSAPP